MLVNFYKPQLFSFCFLDLSNEKCLERLHKRARNNEPTCIDLNYLEKIRTEHLTLCRELTLHYATFTIYNDGV